jgi:selenophosphate synthetase-related protein
MLSDEAKYHVRKTKEHHYYLKVKDGEFILGLIDTDNHVNIKENIYQNEKMPFELFCEIVESVSLKYKENELLKELNELEKAKKDIEEKIEKLKK